MWKVFSIHRLAAAKVSHSLGARLTRSGSICAIDSDGYTHDTRYNYVLRLRVAGYFSFMFCIALFRLKVLLSHHICWILNNKWVIIMKRCQCALETQEIWRRKTNNDDVSWEQRTKKTANSESQRQRWQQQYTHHTIDKYEIIIFFSTRSQCLWRWRCMKNNMRHCLRRLYTNIGTGTHWRVFCHSHDFWDTM